MYQRAHQPALQQMPVTSRDSKSAVKRFDRKHGKDPIQPGHTNTSRQFALILEPQLSVAVCCKPQSRTDRIAPKLPSPQFENWQPLFTSALPARASLLFARLLSLALVLPSPRLHLGLHQLALRSGSSLVAGSLRVSKTNVTVRVGR